MPRSLKILFAALVFTLLAFFIVTAYYFFVATITVPPNAAIRLKHGDRFPQVVSKLSDGYKIKPKFSFIFWMRLTDSTKRIQAGEYGLTTGMTLNDIRHKIISGDVITHNITFIEGNKFSTILKQLMNNNILRHDLKPDLTDKQIMKLLTGVSESPEGRFFPDTYSYHWGDSDIDILRRANKKMTAVLQAEWKSRADNLWYKTAYQALTVASLIQVETANSSELDLVASVILNRLKMRMRLQVDPTVVYGLGHDFGYRLTRRDLRQKTAYNTYRIYGLPPTPIDMPGLAAIHAALHPVETNFLYYVSRNDGSHKFSATYVEHLRAVYEFQRPNKSDKQSANKG